MTITEYVKPTPDIATSLLRFDRARDIWILQSKLSHAPLLLEVILACCASVFLFWSSIDTPLFISIILFLAICYFCAYSVLKRRIHQIEIDLSRSRIRLIEVSLLLSKKVTYFEFSSVQFLRSVMITADDCSYNTLQLVLKSGEVPVEIARFDKVPVTDGSISFRQPITENPQAQALRKELCRMTGIRDFGFLCSFSANPIDMGQP